MIPHTPYYGTADATPLYLVALHAAWRATGDRALIERHLPNAEACLTWIDKYGDRDGDGFQEYQTRSTAGYENMAWKDSGDAVMYPDGTLVRGPKALCELQGYVYDAWLRMAEIYDELGNKRRANALRKKAAALFEKVQRGISGTRNPASMPSRWTARRKRCCRWRPMSGIACGPASSRRNAPAAW